MALLRSVPRLAARRADGSQSCHISVQLICVKRSGHIRRASDQLLLQLVGRGVQPRKKAVHRFEGHSLAMNADIQCGDGSAIDGGKFCEFFSDESTREILPNSRSSSAAKSVRPRAVAAAGVEIQPAR